MADPIPPQPIPQPLPVGPPQVSIPQWLVTLILMSSGFVKSPWLHTLLTIAGSAFAVPYVVSQQLPAMLEKAVPNVRPRLIPLPKKADDAIGQIIFGNSACTATVIGPVYDNAATLDILTAAHCVRVGAKGQMRLKDGRVLHVVCVARDAESDCAWLRADSPGGEIPYLLLSDDTPEAGSAVWHQGYGIDKPVNKELGIFKGVTQNGKQFQYLLSVSSGDSGGAIVLDSGGRVLSPVCCTTKMAGKGDVWGATPQACAALRPVQRVVSEEPPLLYPVMPVPDGFEWSPEFLH